MEMTRGEAGADDADQIESGTATRTVDATVDVAGTAAEDGMATGETTGGTVTRGEATEKGLTI